MIKVTCTTEAAIQAALNKTNEELGCPISLPNGYEMETWATYDKAVDQDLWFFEKPKDEIVSKLVDITLMENDPAWYPPIDEEI